MDADYSFYVKTIETYARTFLALNISAIGRVVAEVLLSNLYTVACSHIAIAAYIHTRFQSKGPPFLQKELICH